MEYASLIWSDFPELLVPIRIFLIELLNQGLPLVKFKSSLRKFYSPHHDLVDRYGIYMYVLQMTRDVFHVSWALFLIQDLSPGV
jgi:hypothetical protein